MVFTHMCRVVAVAGMFVGVIFIGLGILDTIKLPQAPWQSKLELNTGFETLLASLALGTLAEISFSLRQKYGPHGNH